MKKEFDSWFIEIDENFNYGYLIEKLNSILRSVEMITPIKKSYNEHVQAINLIIRTKDEILFQLEQKENKKS